LPADARERAVANARFEQADAQTHSLPQGAFGVAISRFGTMFFADPVAAFTDIAGALRTGAPLCLATWQPLAANDWLTIPTAVLLSYATPPDPANDPGMFAQSDSVALAATLTPAGFDAIHCEPVTISMTIGADPAEAAEYLTTSRPGRTLLDSIPDQVRAAAIEELRGELARHTGSGVVLLNAASADPWTMAISPP